MKEIEYDEWVKEGTDLFGEDITKWKFVCPACKTVQTVQDLLDAGVEKKDIDGYLAFSCIGRFTAGKKGCDWTLGGLLTIHKVEVLTDGGGKRRVFEFAETNRRERLKIDENIKEAIDVWIKYGLKPGSCTEFLLRGDYERAFKHAHPIIKPHFYDHIIYVESISEECRGENYDTWKGNEG